MAQYKLFKKLTLPEQASLVADSIYFISGEEGEVKVFVTTGTTPVTAKPLGYIVDTKTVATKEFVLEETRKSKEGKKEPVLSSFKKIAILSRWRAKIAKDLQWLFP